VVVWDPQVFLAAALVMVGLLMMSQYIKPVLSRVTELNPVEVCGGRLALSAV